MKHEIDFTQSFEDISKISARLSMQSNETVDAFIFKVIYPFSQNLTEYTISKKFLENAIRKQTPSPVVFGNGVALDRCPMCMSFVSDSCKYCPNCGQLLNHEQKVFYDDIGNMTP